MAALRVCLDLDGVLVDFVRGAAEAHGQEIPEPQGEALGWAMERWWGMSPAAFWAPLNTAEFWNRLLWTQDGVKILVAVLALVPEQDVCLLSSPSSAPESAMGKLQWIARELPAFKRRYLLGPAKEFAASRDTVLIDDSEANIAAFRSAGGHAIRVPRAWNCEWEQRHRAPEIVGVRLRSLLGE